jgi:NADH:ubiquinone oxidoreductase subunit C
MLNNYLISLFKKLFAKPIGSISLEYYPLVNFRNSVLEFLPKIFTILKLSTCTRLNTLVELTSYDVPSHVNRFTLNFFLLSVEYNYRLTLNISLSQVSFVPSLSHVYLNAN